MTPLVISLSDSKILIAGGGNDQVKSRHAYILSTSTDTTSLYEIQNSDFAFTSAGIHISPSESNQLAKFLAIDGQKSLHLMTFDPRTESFQSLLRLNQE